MEFFELIEISIITILVAFFITQIIWPIISNKQLFPLWRKANRALDKETALLNNSLDIAAKKASINEVKKQLITESPTLKETLLSDYLKEPQPKDVVFSTKPAAKKRGRPTKRKVS